MMLHDIVKVKVVKNHTLYLHFDNGKEGEVNIAEVVPFEGVFAKLENPEYFAKVQLNEELGTVVWDNGADLSPCYLYSLIQ